MNPTDYVFKLYSPLHESQNMEVDISSNSVILDSMQIALKLLFFHSLSSFSSLSDTENIKKHQVQQLSAKHN